MDKNNLVWIDMEMTGLDPESEQVIEIATIVTDQHLNILAEGPELVIHQSTEVLNNMNSWCIEHHGKSGLTERVKMSKISCAQAEIQTLNFLKKWVPEGVVPLCGNSISQDRRFMVKHMPTLEAFFHYRNIDVSTIKELAKRWSPEVEKSHKKSGTHLALQDIKESISELQHYKKYFFKF